MSDFYTPEFIQKLNAHLERGGVIAFATDTVWGLGALPTDAGAHALYEIKHRPLSKRLIIMSDSVEHIRPYMADFPDAAFDLAKKYWPGALTIAHDGIAGWRGGVRVPDCASFAELCHHVDGHCLATTSANLSGLPPCQSAAEIRETFPDIIVIDTDTPPVGGRPSTVVLVADDGNLSVVRPGAVVIS